MTFLSPCSEYFAQESARSSNLGPWLPGGKLISSLPSHEDFSVSNILLTERSQVAVWQLRRYEGNTAAWWGPAESRELAAAEISGACSALQWGLAAAADLHLNVRCEEETLHLTIVTQSGVWSQLSPVSVPAPPPSCGTQPPRPCPPEPELLKPPGGERAKYNSYLHQQQPAAAVTRVSIHF